MIRKWIIPVIFIAGLLVFLYPIVSNFLSAKEHYSVISKHNEVLAQMSEEEKAAERKKAEQYNKAINQALIPVADPFAENTEDEEVVTGYFNALNIGETMGRIEIPSIKVSIPIYHGVSDDVLQSGIGHMSNSSLPIGGLGTHTALTGHRGLPTSKLFRDLDKVEEGELFFIHTLDDTLAYKVDHIQFVLPDETNWLEMKEDKDYATLITCEPYMINTHRLLVRGERVPYEQSLEVAATKDLSKKVNNTKTGLLIGGILTILLLITIYYRRKMQMKE